MGSVASNDPRTAPRLLCTNCYYDLQGVPDPRCPECGHAFYEPHVRSFWEWRYTGRREALRMLLWPPIVGGLLVGGGLLVPPMQPCCAAVAVCVMFFGGLLNDYILADRLEYTRILRSPDGRRSYNGRRVMLRMAGIVAIQVVAVGLLVSVFAGIAATLR